MNANCHQLAKKVATFLCAAILSWEWNATAGTVYVDAAIGNDNNSGTAAAEAVKTLSKAIEKALNGDTISIAPGTYSGTANRNLNWNAKNLRMIGSGSAVQTIIDLENAGCFLNLSSSAITSATSKLQNLTIRNGSSANGGGLYLTDAGLTVDNCIFYLNVSNIYGGGAARLQNSSSKFMNCRFVMNQKTGADSLGPSGGGAMAIDRGNLEIVNCTFSNNTADCAAALFIAGTSTKVSIDKSVFESNTADHAAVIDVDFMHGGDIELNIANSLIYNNTSTGSNSIISANLS